MSQTPIRRFPRILLAVFIILLLPHLAAAQEPEKIGRFVVDARGSVAKYSAKPPLSGAFALPNRDVPTRGLGFDVGGHVYVFTWRVVTIGLGVDVMLSRGRHSPATQGTTQTSQPALPDIKTKFEAVAPQLSLNFGSGRGWSYLSGGLGPARLTIKAEDALATEYTTRRLSTLNYGGGARWFAKDRLAFSIDVRLYAISPEVGVGSLPGIPRMTFAIINIGASFK